MRLAVISDIHGNLAALRAVLTRIEQLSIDRIINLGDCASGPLWPAETVAFLRARNWLHVRGNHDRMVGASADGILGRSDSATWQALDADARQWLFSLPPNLSLEGALFVHASLEGDDTYLLDHVTEGRLCAAPPNLILRRLAGLDARAIFCGHSHLPRHIDLPGGILAVNPGSVGWPAFRHAVPPYICETGSPHARFAIAEFSGTAITARLESVAYDWEVAARRATENSRPDWAHALRTGRAPG